MHYKVIRVAEAIVVLAAVAVLGWQAHDWITPAAAPSSKPVVVRVQAPDPPALLITDPNGRHPGQLDPN
jgi:hypothetical protein